MAHLIVHLANEALLGGPVQFRWQFCIEREFKYIQRITGNKAKIEACIGEATCLREMADAATTYYPDEVPTLHITWSLVTMSTYPRMTPSSKYSNIPVARPVEYKNINWRRKRRIALCSVFL
jgi:hypothetical protein